MAWAWGCRSVVQSSKRTADGCGRAPMRPAAPSFNSPCPPNQTTRPIRDAAIPQTNLRAMRWMPAWLRARLAEALVQQQSHEAIRVRLNGRGVGQLNPSFQFDADGVRDLQVAWEDGERVFCRGWRADSEGGHGAPCWRCSLPRNVLPRLPSIALPTS